MISTVAGQNSFIFFLGGEPNLAEQNKKLAHIYMGSSSITAFLSIIVGGGGGLMMHDMQKAPMFAFL